MQVESSADLKPSQNQFTQCLLCGNVDLAPLTLYQNAYLVQCKNCDFVFSKKIPSSDELIAHYHTYPRNDKISAITLKRYEELLEYFGRFRETGNILDVGCGNGHFLTVAKKKGWNVYGTEYTEEAVAICRQKNITMFEGKLNPGDFSNTKFDVITSFEVLEHINNPVEELKHFNTLLRKNGIVYLTTPNFNSLSRFLLKEKWNIIEYPEHLCYYTPKTLAYIFHRSGFNQITIKTTGISFNRFQVSIKANTNYVLNSDEKFREKTERSFIFAMLKKIANGLLTSTGKGDTIKAVFKKQN